MFEKLKKLDHILQTTPEERRRESREALDGALVVVDGDAYGLADWSAHGFCVAEYTAERKPGDRVEMYFSIPMGDETLEFKCRTVIARYDAKKKELGGMFSNLDDEMQDLIDEHFNVFSAKRYSKGLMQGLKSTLKRSGDNED